MKLIEPNSLIEIAYQIGGCGQPENLDGLVELAQLEQDLFLFSLRQSSEEAVSGSWKSLKKLQHLQAINSQWRSES